MATHLKRISQYPMSFKDALAALLRAKPVLKKKDPKPNRSLKQASIRP